MADSPTVEVKGAEQLSASLQAAGADLADMQRAASAVGSMVANAAQGIAPKRTGALAASVRPVTTVANVIDIAADEVYAGPIHWGWPAHGIAAQPFIEEAINTTEAETVAIYAEELEDILSRVKGDE